MQRVVLAAVVCALTMIAAAPATDDLAKAIGKCAILKGDLERLECYDGLARARGLQGPQTVPTSVRGAGRWHVAAEKNPVDDTKTVTLMLDAASGVSQWGHSISLILRCKSNTTEVYIAWDAYLGSEATVLTRVGSTKAVTQRWDLSSDSKATFYPGDHVSFIKSLLQADKLVAQVTPYDESPVTAVFDLSGLSTAIKPLQETCAWHTEEAAHLEPTQTPPDDDGLAEGGVDDSILGGMLGGVEGGMLDQPLYAGIGGVTNPELVTSTKKQPTYPEMGRNAKVSGQVILQVVVRKDGTVGDIQVLRSPGSKFGFDDAAIVAVRQWRYKPALQKGKPVDAYFTVVVEFVLPEKPD